ncbi:MAG: hypothetical protein WDZ68_02270 [Candidatus Paceibacterota bacterium]
MSDQENQSSKEAQKTIISFIAGLIIGGLLVWMFGGTNDATPTDDVVGTNNFEEVDTNDDTEEDDDATPTTNDELGDTNEPTVENGDGSIDVSDQPAGDSVTLTGAVFPNDEGWIGVRDYVDGALGSLLGVTRFSREQGRLPTTISLQRATETGEVYAVVFYTESGDREFNLDDDTLIVGTVETFTAE